MAKKDEKVFIQIDNEKIELTGDALEKFELDRSQSLAERNDVLLKQEAQKELKISAYKKLGLTDEEIQAII